MLTRFIVKENKIFDTKFNRFMDIEIAVNFINSLERTISRLQSNFRDNSTYVVHDMGQ